MPKKPKQSKQPRPNRSQQRVLAHACSMKDLSTTDINRRRDRALDDAMHIEREISRLAQELHSLREQRAKLYEQVEGADSVLASR